MTRQWQNLPNGRVDVSRSKFLYVFVVVARSIRFVRSIYIDLLDLLDLVNLLDL